MALIAFYTHPLRPEAAALAGRAEAWLAQRGHRSVSALRPDGSVSVDGADLLVSLGGDGTLLRAVEAALAGGIPVLGVNIGRLGYLTQVEPAGLEEALAAFLAGTHQVEERMTLSVHATAPDGTDVARRTALNEATVEKTVPGHTVRIGRLHRREALRDLCRRRAARLHADRVDRLQPVGPRPGPVAASPGHRGDPGLAPHDLRPAPRPRSHRTYRRSRSSSRDRPCWSSTGSRSHCSSRAPPSSAVRGTSRRGW